MLRRWPISLDIAACRTSALVPSYCGPDHLEPARRDALLFQDWTQLAGEGVVWMNPPYTPAQHLSAFLARAAATAAAGVPVVGLVPASTGTVWWWNHIVAGGARVEFLRGRLTFTGPHSSGAAAPWASALVIWSPDDKPTSGAALL